MARPPRTPLQPDELEPRYAPAVLSYTAPAGNGADVITVRLDSAGKRVEILDDGKVVASRNVGSTDAVVITANQSEGDSLVGDYLSSTKLLTVPITFDGGASGAAAKLTSGKGTVTVDLSGSSRAIRVDIGQTVTTVYYLDGNGNKDGGGTVTVRGPVSKVVATSGNDRINDLANRDLSLSGGKGNDSYRLDAGSTITVTDDGGDDTVDFGRSGDSITATMGDTSSTVVDSGGDMVIFTGMLENVGGTAGNDTITGNSADNVMDGGAGNDRLDGGAGDDVYMETPGSDDVIIDSGGVDTIDFSAAARGITLDLTLTAGQWQSVDAAGNRLALFGTIENVIGSGFDDNFTGNPADNLMCGGAGDDRLVGGPGRDILVGGTGADRLNGSSDEDLLIAGFTAYDTGPLGLTAWAAIQGVWTGSGTVEQRIAALNDPVATYRLRATGPNATVFDDGDADVLTGSQSADWYFAAVPGTDPGNDTITDKDNQEFVNDLA